METVLGRSCYTAGETDWIGPQSGIRLEALRPNGVGNLRRAWSGQLPEWHTLPGAKGLQAAFPLRSTPEDGRVNDLCVRFRRDGKDQAVLEEAWLRPAPSGGVVYQGVEEILVQAETQWAADVRLMVNGEKTVRRYSLRPYGLVGLRAGYQGGMVLTKPLLCTGNSLLLNYATSAAGGVRAGILEGAESTPVCGRSPEDCDLLYGNELAEQVTYRGNGDLSFLQGKTVRLVFEMHDCILCSFRFADR